MPVVTRRQKAINDYMNKFKVKYEGEELFNAILEGVASQVIHTSKGYKLVTKELTCVNQEIEQPVCTHILLCAQEYHIGMMKVFDGIADKVKKED